MSLHDRVYGVCVCTVMRARTCVRVLLHEHACGERMLLRVHAFSCVLHGLLHVHAHGTHMLLPAHACEWRMWLLQYGAARALRIPLV